MKVGMNSFCLKLIAIIAMTLDHIGALFFKGVNPYIYLLLRSIGAMTFPIMAYMICEGYRNTRDLNRYKIRLIVFSVVSMLPFALAFGKDTYGLNVGFTLLFGLCAIEVYDKVEIRMAKWIVILLMSVLSYRFDWGFTGVWLIVILYIAGNNKRKIAFALLVAVMLFVAENQVVHFIEVGRFFKWRSVFKSPAFLRHIGFLGAAFVLFFYNKQRGIKAKWLFYIYYPVHLVVLAALCKVV